MATNNTPTAARDTDESRWLDQPDLPTPDVEAVGDWKKDPGDTEPGRELLGFDRTVRNHPALVYAAGTQHLDGTIHRPQVILANGEAHGFDLSSDQARELATALTETANEADRWVATHMTKADPKPVSVERHELPALPDRPEDAPQDDECAYASFRFDEFATLRCGDLRAEAARLASWEDGGGSIEVDFEARISGLPEHEGLCDVRADRGQLLDLARIASCAAAVIEEAAFSRD